MKAFISSTYKDLIDHRQKVGEALERLGQQGIRMEVFGARPEEATEACINEINESDIFIGVYAHRYGFISEGNTISITELEYKYAETNKKPLFCFLLDDDFPWKPSFIDGDSQQAKLKTFKECINKSVVRDIFTTPDDLAFKVATSIGRYIFTKSIKEELDKTAQKQPIGSENKRNQVARRAERLSRIIQGSNILLVNDVPEQMIGVINIYKSMGITVTIAINTETAINLLEANKFDLIVSDISRDGIPDEGLKFLNKMRTKMLFTPTIFTVGNYEPQKGTPPYAFAITNRIDELLNFTFDILERVYG